MSWADRQKFAGKNKVVSILELAAAPVQLDKHDYYTETVRRCSPVE